MGRREWDRGLRPTQFFQVGRSVSLQQTYVITDIPSTDTSQCSRTLTHGHRHLPALTCTCLWSPAVICTRLHLPVVTSLKHDTCRHLPVVTYSCAHTLVHTCLRSHGHVTSQRTVTDIIQRPNTNTSLYSVDVSFISS